jgi:hypothetical protein
MKSIFSIFVVVASAMVINEPAANVTANATVPGNKTANNVTDNATVVTAIYNISYNINNTLNGFDNGTLLEDSESRKRRREDIKFNDDKFKS